MQGMDALLLQSPSQLAQHLKSLRRSRQMTQADMALRLQITQERYSQIERHPELIATGRLLEIFAALEVDLLLRLRPADNAPAPPRQGEDW
jgi:HTH-type transcriptional regulator / antitoxin HipB